MQDRTAVLFSGSGSTLQAILDQSSMWNVALTVSSRRNALGCSRSKRAGIQSTVMKFPERFNDLLRLLQQRSIRVILLLGFMKVIPEDFLNEWKRLGGRIYNIHPSLLPNYKGLHAFERAYADGADIGATLHEVWPELDAGPVCTQLLAISSFEIRKSDFKEAQIRLRAVEQSLLKRWRMT